MVTIDVDYRESEVIPKFKKFIKSGKTKLVDGIDVVPLEVGDVVTKDNLVGIERKGDDFVNSMFSERLDKQLTELKENYAFPFLFVEYDGIEDLILKNRNVNPKSLVGEFCSIMARHHVSVMFVGGYFVPFTIRTIEKFYDGKNKTKKYSPIRKSKVKKTKATPQEVKIDIVGRFPSIGARKGTKLLEHFNYSIYQLSNASIEELQKVDGIGNKLAKEIHEILR